MEEGRKPREHGRLTIPSDNVPKDRVEEDCTDRRDQPRLTHVDVFQERSHSWLHKERRGLCSVLRYHTSFRN